MRTRSSLILPVVLCLAAGMSGAERPVIVSVPGADGEKILGTLMEHDEEGLTIRDLRGGEHRVGWDALEPRHAYALHKRVFGDGGDATRWFTLGERLAGVGDRQWSEAAFGDALALDPSLEAAVNRVRAAATYRKPEPHRVVPPARSEPDAASPRRWEPLDNHQSAQAVEDLKRFAEGVIDAMGLHAMRLREGRYFLIYSDVERGVAQDCEKLLDAAYADLCGRFGLSHGKSIFHGKALVFIFARTEDFMRYQAGIERSTAPGRSGGVCYYRGEHVRIAMHTPPGRERFDFATLVHESSHAFLYRYRAPVIVPNWLDEGVAEAVMYTTVLGADERRAAREAARTTLRKHGHTGGMFQLRNLHAPHYPIAYTLADYMMTRDINRYRAMIDAIKDGQPWPAALKEQYGTTLEELVAAYAYALDAGEVRP